MTVVEKPCPTDEELSQVLECQASDELHLSVIEHLGECDACVKRLDGLAGARHEELFATAGPVVADDRSEHRNTLYDSTEKNFLARLQQPFPYKIPKTIGPYRVVRKLGQGAMGDVFECVDDRLARRVAVKTIRFQMLGKEQLERMAQEARVQAGLNHPRIVQLYDFGTPLDGVPYLAMELVEGGTLTDRLRKGRIPPGAAARLVLELAEAVEHAHSRGVMHRDLKPSNILLSKSESSDAAQDMVQGLENAKIADFGLARFFDADSLITQSGLLVGTPAYMSPEQMRSGSKLGPASDIYSLGVILYELLTGEIPFRGNSLVSTVRMIQETAPTRPRAMDKSVPKDLETICLKCLEKRPEDRYGMAIELALDLDRYLNGLPITARPVPLSGQFSRWVRRNKSLAVSMGAILVLVAIGAVSSVLFALKEAELRAEATESAARAMEERDFAFTVLTDSTDALFTAYLNLKMGPETPTTQAGKTAIADKLFNIVNKTTGLQGFRDIDPLFMMNFSYKVGTIYWEMDQRDKAYEAFQQALLSADKLGKEVRVFDVTQSRLINATMMSGFYRWDKGDRQYVLETYREVWQQSLDIPPIRLRNSFMLLESLRVFGKNFVYFLKLDNHDEEANEVLKKIEELDLIEQERATQTSQPK